MESLHFGSTGLPVSRAGLGCVTFGREISEAESFAILDHAVSRGVNLVDTAEAYGEGASERILGNWFARTGCRDQVLVVTKVTTDFTRQHVREALDASRERLRTDCVDIYLMHQFDGGTPLEEALEAMTAVVESGAARFAGCSNFTARQLRQALDLSCSRGLAGINAVQSVYNLLARQIGHLLLPLCEEENIGVMSYSPLGAGFLTGKYTAGRDSLPQGSRFAIKPAHADLYFSEENFHLTEKLRELSGRTGFAMTRLAMGWVMANCRIGCVLAGARHPTHLDNAIESARQPLPAEILDEINGWF